MLAIQNRWTTTVVKEEGVDKKEIWEGDESEELRSGPKSRKKIWSATVRAGEYYLRHARGKAYDNCERGNNPNRVGPPDLGGLRPDPAQTLHWTDTM